MNPQSPPTLADPALFDHPYPIYDRMRAQGPVYLDPVLGLYIVVGSKELDHVLHNQQDFSSVPDPRVMAFYSNADDIMALYEQEGGWPPMSTLVTTDPPDHRRYRALVEKAVGAANVRQLRVTVQRVANELVDAFVDRGQVDLQEALAFRLPLFVITDLLGVPRSIADTCRAMGEATTKLADATRLTTEEILEGHRTQIRGQKVFQEYIEQFRATPQDNLLSHLVHARLDKGESLSDRELHSVLQALLVGGNDTTPGGIGNCALFLARDAALQSRLRSDPALIPNFVEEALRLESPVQGLFRRTTRDLVLGGVSIPADSTLVVRYAAANRDGAVFDRPDEMDLDRKGIRNHHAFGGGIHYCVGNILARMEVNVAMEVLLARLDRITLDPPDHLVRYVPKLVVRNPESLPIRFQKRG